MADLFAEVDEAMRQERMEKFWKDYGTYIIIFVVGVIVMTGIVSGYKHWNAYVKKQQTSETMALLDAPDFPDNILDAQDLDLRPGLRGVVYLNAAGEFMDDGNSEKALTLYERASADKGIPDELRQIATLAQVKIISENEAANPEELIALLEPVLQKTQSPWQPHAHLQAALIYAHLAENYSKALEHLDAVLTEENPGASVQQRAAALKHVYTLKEQALQKTLDKEADQNQ
jgi:hypothetical protein